MEHTATATLLKRPIRRCAACRQRFTAEDLLHFSKVEAGYVLSLDAGSGHGRGLYLCPDRQCLKKYQDKIGNNLEQIAQLYAQAIEQRDQQLTQSGNTDKDSPARLELQKNTKLLVALRNSLTKSHLGK